MTKIGGRKGWYVDQVWFEYSDGSKSKWGGNGGGASTPFVLNEDEYITKIDLNATSAY